MNDAEAVEAITPVRPRATISPKARRLMVGNPPGPGYAFARSATTNIPTNIGVGSVTGFECVGEAGAGGDLELLVGVGEGRLDGAHRDEERRGDLFVGHAAGRHERAPPLAGGERLDPGADDLARPGAGRGELLVGLLGQGNGAAGAR